MLYDVIWDMTGEERMDKGESNLELVLIRCDTCERVDKYGNSSNVYTALLQIVKYKYH